MPFLRNIWYVAAHAEEIVGDGLVSRMICGEPIVMFRTSAGQVAALQDQCPHRFVPLSAGKRIGDVLECGYHGLRFDGTGACIDMPNDHANTMLKPCIKSYPVIERDAIVWIWMGAPELADSAKTPDFGFLADKRFAVGVGYLHVKANYQLIVDNLLDLSHVHYLHPQIQQGTNFSEYKNEMRIEGETIWSMLWRPRYVLPDFAVKASGFASNEVEGQGHSRWNAPGAILVFTAFWEHGKTIEQGSESPSAHLLTPETEFTTHYFWGVGRTYDVQNEALTKVNVEMTGSVFATQDAPMIEKQQLSMGATADFLEQKPVILKADAAGVAARRLMKRKIMQEQTERGDRSVRVAEG